MKLSAFVSAVGVGVALPAPELTLSEIAAHVNADPTSSWRAHSDGRYDNLSMAESYESLRARCGTILAHDDRYVDTNISEPSFEELGLDASLSVEDLPTSFDWRSQGRCDSVVGYVRDQSACGSCWAFSASEAFTDRRCVQANDTKIYSSMDVAANCHGLLCGLSNGCGGGQQGAALGWISLEGVVTGGNYEDMHSGKECLDYSFPTCAHHVPPTPGHPACPTKEYKTERTSKCNDASYPTAYREDKVKGAGEYAVRGVAKIMQDLMVNGPQAVSFTVYTDFETYKSGVYTHKTGRMAGGHAVEFVGKQAREPDDAKSCAPEPTISRAHAHVDWCIYALGHIDIGVACLRRLGGRPLRR